jgi:hypothetical protein
MTYLNFASRGTFSLTVPQPGEALLRAADGDGSCSTTHSSS